PHKLKLQMSLGEALGGVADRRPVTPVPYEHRSAAILALGDRALEVTVFDRVILDPARKALLRRHQAGAAGDGPALQGSIHLQPQIVVQPPRGMFLDDEAAAGTGAKGTLRLGRAAEVALLVIG